MYFCQQGLVPILRYDLAQAIEISILYTNKTKKLNICRPHLCICGSSVDKLGVHGLSCNLSADRRSRHVFL